MLHALSERKTTMFKFLLFVIGVLFAAWLIRQLMPDIRRYQRMMQM
jgi:flagellar biogenesis protein FliO